jgi:O-antigen/teichoic acid export membrane protein
LAYQCATVLGLVLTEFNRSVMGRYVELDSKSAGKTIVLHVSINFGAFSLFMAGTLLLAPVVFRDSYSIGYEYVGPLLFSQLIYGLYYIPVNILSLTHAKNGKLWRASAAGAITNVGLNFALIPALGAWGGVWSTIAGYAVMLGVALRYERRLIALLHQSFPLRVAVPALLAAAAQAAVTLIESTVWQAAVHAGLIVLMAAILLSVVRRQSRGRLERSLHLEADI